MDSRSLGLSTKHSIMMEDVKFKFLGLINKQNQLKIPSMGLNPDLLNPTDSIDYVDQSKAGKFTDNELLPDQEILESIEQIYYETDSNFDLCRYELERLPNVLDSKLIDSYRKKLKQQHQVVSNKVLQLILQKQNDCKKEFDNIFTMQGQLQDLLSICRIGRTDLELARKQFTTASLGILANYRKRQIVEDLLNSLNIIKTLQRTESRVQELLKKENYPDAISLLLECQNAAQTYKHFQCISALNSKLLDTLEQIEQTLDLTLKRMCTQFESNTYTAVQDAYSLLGKSQAAIERLHLYFTATIHDTAYKAICFHTDSCPKWEFKQLCEAVPQSSFVPCLVDLCHSRWAILYSYYSIVEWHKSREVNEKEEGNLENNFDHFYVKQKLENGIKRIWNDVETKISSYLMDATLTNLKFEQFVQILSIVNRLMEIGDKLYSSRSEKLQDRIRQRCLSYFSHYHSLRLDELRIFLEHDGWEICPVKQTFSITQLQEFKSLRHVLTLPKTWNSTDNTSDNDSSTASNNSAWLQKCLDDGSSPFGVGLDETIDEDILTNVDDEMEDYFSEDSEDEISDEMKKDSIDELENTKVIKKRHKMRYNGPIVTNTTLSVLRVCGKYLQMIRLLKSIAMTVIQNMMQFFELYFYAVHIFFSSDLIIPFNEYLYSKKLNLSLNRIKENFIIDETEEEHVEGNLKYKVKQSQLSSTGNLSDSGELLGLTERIAAMESLIFLGKQYENFKNYFEYLTTNSPEHSYLQIFFTQTVTSATDLRRPIYMSVASQAIDVKYILQLINKVDWKVRDVVSQHSEYVDVLIEKIKTLKTKLNEIGNSVPLPKEVYASIWENVAFLTAITLVDGFSGSEKCSNGGRALMQLDYTQLASKFENMTSIRPMPYKEYIESYVKAYYLSENDLETWIKEKQEYSQKHKIGLISCVCQNKKVRQRMIAMIEEQMPNKNIKKLQKITKIFQNF